MFQILNRFLHKLILSKLAYVIWVSFKYSPTDWEGYEDRYRISHKTNGTTIWIGNGRSFFNIEHENDHNKLALLGYLDRFFVYSAFKQAKKKLLSTDKYYVRIEYMKKFTTNKNK